jgi:LysR family glycine cleavage system transcriptional activator
MLNPTSELLNLDRTGIDLAIRYGNGNWSGLKSELLFKGSFAIVAASSLIGKTKIRKPLDILNFPILMELGSTEFSDWLKRQGIDPSKHANITRMPGNLLLDGLRRGDGIVATVPRFIKRDLDAGRLTVLFEDRLDSGYYLLTRPGPHRAPQTKFVRWLRTAKSEN